MGGICSKGISSNDHVADHENHANVIVVNNKDRDLGSGGEKVALAIEADSTQGGTPISSDERGVDNNEEEPAKPKPFVWTGSIASAGQGQGQPRVSLSRIVSITRGERGAQVLAGWPSWLTAFAGEAISGWIPRTPDSFEKLDKIGQGTYGSVYKARDLEANKIVALKKVRFDNTDPESVRFMAREILVLRRLDHPNVMKLEGIITSRVSGCLYLIFEYMEHDLAGLSVAATHGINFTEAQIKCYMQQLLRGLEHCHSHGVLHRDIKCSNLLLDNNGNLKMGDFGLATLSQGQGQVLTSRVVTLWYRPPELLLGATHYGAAVDLWSAGCILAELFAGKPIMPGRTEVEQLHKIFKLCGSPSEEYWMKSHLKDATIFKPQQPYKRVVGETFKDFPSSALNLLDILLAIDPKDRGTASLALENEFFMTKPLACDPSTLPKFPPSKEFDAKLREEQAKRGRAGKRGREDEELLRRRSFRDYKGVAAGEEDGVGGAKSGALVPGHPSVYNINMNFKEEGVSRSRNCGQLRKQRSCWHIHNSVAHLSRSSNSVAVRGDSQLRLDCSSSVHLQWQGPDGDGDEDVGPHEDDHPFAKGFAPKNSRLHYSGPLLPRGGNLEEMLKEHERQIQQAVRKVCLNQKDKTN